MKTLVGFGHEQEGRQGIAWKTQHARMYSANDLHGLKNMVSCHYFVCWSKSLKQWHPIWCRYGLYISLSNVYI